MYSMPIVGTNANLYFPSERSQDPMVIGCVRTNGSSYEKFSDVNNRYFATESGNNLDMLPDAINFSRPGLSATFNDGGGVNLSSSSTLSVNAGTVGLFAGNVTIQGQSKVIAEKGGSIISLENDFYDTASIIKENGRDRTTNTPFDDDPQNGADEAKAAQELQMNEAALVQASEGTSSAIGEISDQSTIGPMSDDSNTEDISFMDKLKSIGYGILDGGSRFSSDTRHFLFEFGDKVLKIDMDTPYKEGAKSPRQEEEEAMAADVKYHNELRDKAPCKSAFDCTSDLSNTCLNLAALYENAKGVYSLAKSAKFYAQGKFGQFKGWLGFKPEKPTFVGEGEFLTPRPQEERVLIPKKAEGIVPKGSEGKITMPKETEGKITRPNEVEGEFKSLEEIKQEQGIKITNKSSSEISTEANSSVGSNESSGKTPSQRIVTQSSTGGGCFLGDTLVYTENGYKQIKDIHSGEKVYSKDIDANIKGLHTVTRVFKNNSSYILHIKVNDEEIRCTLEHPFGLANKGWVPAKDIQAGDEIETYNGQSVCVSEIIIDRLTEIIDIYNIEVEEVSTYYVSELNLLVHNDGCSTSGKGTYNNPQKAIVNNNKKSTKAIKDNNLGSDGLTIDQRKYFNDKLKLVKNNQKVKDLIEYERHITVRENKHQDPWDYDKWHKSAVNMRNNNSRGYENEEYWKKRFGKAFRAR